MPMSSSHLDADDVHEISEDRESRTVKQECLWQHLSPSRGTREAHWELEQAQH